MNDVFHQLDRVAGKGTPELLDAAATVEGGGVGVWIAYFAA